MERLLAASDAIDRVLVRIGMAAGWLFVVCTVAICFDVLSRKFPKLDLVILDCDQQRHVALAQKAALAADARDP